MNDTNKTQPIEITEEMLAWGRRAESIRARQEALQSDLAILARNCNLTLYRATRRLIAVSRRRTDTVVL